MERRFRRDLVGRPLADWSKFTRNTRLIKDGRNPVEYGFSSDEMVVNW